MGSANILKVEMFPIFHAANFIHKSNIVRDDSTPTNFSRNHPFSSWASTMVACFAQKFLANALLAVPIIDSWQDSRLVVMATCIWYFINYSLFDIVHDVTKFRVVQLIVGIMLEFFRTNQIYEGVNLAMEKYIDAPFIALSIGTISGNGVRFMLLIHRLLRGIWTPADVEFMTPACDTRSSFIASLIFWHAHGEIRPDVFLRVFAFLLLMKALKLWVGNPYGIFEKIIYSLTIGIWDSISGLLARKIFELRLSGVTEDAMRRTRIKKSSRNSKYSSSSRRRPRSKSRSCSRKR